MSAQGAPTHTAQPVALADVVAPDVPRVDTGFPGVNDVLGGGFPEGAR